MSWSSCFITSTLLSFHVSILGDSVKVNTSGEVELNIFRHTEKHLAWEGHMQVCGRGPVCLELAMVCFPRPRICTSEPAGVSLALVFLSPFQLLKTLPRPLQSSLKAVYCGEKVTLKLIVVWKCL